MFIKEEYNKEFLEKGYLVFPLLDSSGIEEVLNVYGNYTMYQNGKANLNSVLGENENNKIADTLKNIVSPYLNRILHSDEYINHGPMFFAKEKPHGEYLLHQDGSIVEKERKASYAWVALQDVSMNNGCMFLIEKSHLFFDNYTSFSLQNSVLQIHDVRKMPLFRKIEMKAGEVLFFHPRLFHGSYANMTDSVRLAINMLITEPLSYLLFYQKTDEKQIKEYYVSSESYRNSYHLYSKGLLPKNAVLSREIMYRHIPIDKKMLEIKCNSFSSLEEKLKTIIRRVV